ncbi:hypothetical protein [Nonomuraea sp. B5E05]|uniref:hypothetical protein n=1 Tax=Nonomuraea sp. B5E05 TaxID=3153569 RepID=UPI003260F398
MLVTFMQSVRSFLSQHWVCVVVFLEKMTKSHNTKAGDALTRLYNRDRILYGQNFFNRFATQLTSVEPMKDLCFQPIATGSTYFNDKPRD